MAPLVLSIDQAADALTISRDGFERHVMADLRDWSESAAVCSSLHEQGRWIDHEMAIPARLEASTSTSQLAFVEGQAE